MLSSTPMIAGCSRRMLSTTSPRVVVLGSGWGGFAAAKALGSQFDVTVVSPHNHLLFTPLLASTAVGTLEFRSITEPVRSLGVHYIKGKCRGVDTDAKTVTVRMESDDGDKASRTTHTLPYDKLVIAFGARSNTFGIPGVTPENGVSFMKEIKDAHTVRSKLLRNLEAATFPCIDRAEQKRLLSFAVVGGGPTGVEFASELYDFLRDDVPKLFPDLPWKPTITLVEGNDILSSFDGTLREWTSQRLKREGIDIVKANVSAVEPGALHLDNDRTVPFGLCVWSTGIAPRKVVSVLDDEIFAIDTRGRLKTDAGLRVQAADGGALPGVYAIGDCAFVAPDGYPATAQVAEQQALFLAAQLNKGDDTGDFKYHHKGTLAYTSNWTAVSDFTALPDSNPARGTTLRGFAAFLVWRTVYLTKQGSWRNRLLVPADWLKTFLWGRNVTIM